MSYRPDLRFPRRAPSRPLVRSAGSARWPRSALVALAAVLAVALAAGCASDGRALREPSAQQTTTTRPPATTSSTVPGGTAPAVFQLTSETFAEGGGIPDVHTCMGDGESPPLLWAGVPQGTVEVAVVVRDLDAGGLVHWVIAGMLPELGGVAQDMVPDGAVQATNAFGDEGWGGPCPESGTHHYEFRVFALSQPSGVTAGQAGDEAARQIETAPALATAALSGTSSAPTASSTTTSG